MAAGKGVTSVQRKSAMDDRDRTGSDTEVEIQKAEESNPVVRCTFRDIARCGCSKSAQSRFMYM
jgi:hypothetical protein